jgi:hypothetical protein
MDFNSTGSKTDASLTAKAWATKIERELSQDAPTFTQRVFDLALGAETFENRIQTLERGGEFTPRGLPSQIKPVALGWRAEQARFRQANKDPLDAQAAEMEAAALTPRPVKPEEAVIRALRHQEIRRLMAGLTDPIDRVPAVNKAAEGGDLDFLTAVSEAPRSFPLVDEAVLAKARSSMAVSASPELVRLPTLRDGYAAVLAVTERDMLNVLNRYGITLADTPAT